jgi:hypothetical protein
MTDPQIIEGLDVTLVVVNNERRLFLTETYPVDVRVRFRLMTGDRDEEIDRVVPAGTTEIPNVGLPAPELGLAIGASFARFDDFTVRPNDGHP